MTDTNPFDVTASEMWDEQPQPSANSHLDTSLDAVEEVVLREFDEQTWNVMEAVMSAHATLCIDGIEGCFGLIIEGPSGSGKSTALRPFEGIHNQFYRTDDVTPASFVSHDSSKTKEELAKDDLLPRIKYQTVLNPEMANWFAGDWGVRKEKMARMVRVMDGRGFTSDSGTHGERGYQGDYRFNFISATTPLDRKDWKMMGHTGNRFLFHEMPASDDAEADRKAIFGDKEYGEKIPAVQEAVHPFLSDLWMNYGGPNSVSWEGKYDSETQDCLLYLSELIRHARVPWEEGEPGEMESRKRVGSMLRDLARGHALLSERAHIEAEDLQVCARVALSTMPHERRQIVREVLRLAVGEVLRTTDVMEELEVSRPTATDRMDMVDSLGIGVVSEESVQGGKAKVLSVESDFAWPSNLPFPSF